MISLVELKKKAERPWNSGTFLKSWLKGEEMFPLEIPFRTPSGRTLGREFSKVREWIALLHNNSKAVKGSGYSVEYRSINHQQLGRQSLPDRILFENSNDLLTYIGRQKAFRIFDELVGTTRRQLPEVFSFIEEKPLKVLDAHESWPAFLKVCRYFQLNPRPGRYIRQLDIQGVDTKFIESHKAILSELLCLALEPEDYDPSVTGLAENGFERRFGLRYDEPLIRFRLLDSQDAITDISVPVSQFADPGVETVFITENKVNGLAFPAVNGAIVIFGLGYGVRTLSSVPWLKNKRLVYWGDIDTHGFSILSRVRALFPKTESMLMDQATLEQHRPLCVHEHESKRFLGELSNLSPDELIIYNNLRGNRLGVNLRLEQERIGYGWLLEVLRQNFQYHF